MFSWRMMLRDKRGQLHFVVKSEKQSAQVLPSTHLSVRQQRKIVGRPELIRQYAVHLANEYRQRWRTQVQVQAVCEVQLNFSGPRPLIDSEFDLAQTSSSLLTYSWIMQR